jgi:dTMP kinase
MDRESPVFHARVRARFHELAVAEPDRFVVIDASQSADALEAQIWSAIAPRLSD